MLGESRLQIYPLCIFVFPFGGNWSPNSMASYTHEIRIPKIEGGA